MGQQQLLLIILGVIIVGIAIAVGLSMFTAQSIGANKDAIISDMTNLSATAYQFRIRPVAMGGGGGTTFVGYTLASVLADNENARYTLGTLAATTIAFSAKSKQDSLNTVAVTYTFTGGKMVPVFVYGGAFE